MSKTILITGASSGIGKATVKKFQAEGWIVIELLCSFLWPAILYQN